MAKLRVLDAFVIGNTSSKKIVLEKETVGNRYNKEIARFDIDSTAVNNLDEARAKMLRRLAFEALVESFKLDKEAELYEYGLEGHEIFTEKIFYDQLAMLRKEAREEKLFGITLDELLQQAENPESMELEDGIKLKFLGVLENGKKFD